jgi:serine/threonine protein phosphatase PrpC
MLRLKHSARSDVGMIRSGNEDNYDSDVNANRGLFIVADGMGGHAAGEVASLMAVQTVMQELTELREIDDGAGAATRLSEALRTANRNIHERTLAESDKQGMGTTASVLVIDEKRYLIGQIGDSRVYLLRDGALHQLTKDHSYVQEQVDAGFLTPEQAKYHPYSNVITRCVGANEDVAPDVYFGNLEQGDVVLLASDGLTGMLEDNQIATIMGAEENPEGAVNKMIADANRRGGLDNITAIVVRVDATDPNTGEMPATRSA